MNIEGGEKPFLESIEDFSNIKHMIISCHDLGAKIADMANFIELKMKY